MQRGVERALLHLEHLARNLLDTLGNGPAVQWFERDGFKNQKVESSLHEVAWFSHNMIIYNMDCRWSRYLQCIVRWWFLSNILRKVSSVDAVFTTNIDVLI